MEYERKNGDTSAVVVPRNERGTKNYAECFRKAAAEVSRAEFECGGTFYGFTCRSDADPGL